MYFTYFVEIVRIYFLNLNRLLDEPLRSKKVIQKYINHIEEQNCSLGEKGEVNHEENERTQNGHRIIGEK